MKLYLWDWYYSLTIEAWEGEQIFPDKESAEKNHASTNLARAKKLAEEDLLERISELQEALKEVKKLTSETVKKRKHIIGA